MKTTLNKSNAHKRDRQGADVTQNHPKQPCCCFTARVSRLNVTQYLHVILCVLYVSIIGLFILAVNKCPKKWWTKSFRLIVCLSRTGR